MTNLSPQEMLDRIKAIDPYVEVKMINFGNFYVGGSRIEEKEGGVLKSLYGNGNTPELAVENHFYQLLNSKNLIYDDYLNKVRVRYSITWNDKFKVFEKKVIGEY